VSCTANADFPNHDLGREYLCVCLDWSVFVKSIHLHASHCGGSDLAMCPRPYNAGAADGDSRTERLENYAWLVWTLPTCLAIALMAIYTHTYLRWRATVGGAVSLLAPNAEHNQRAT
jgi:hypothetical protein